MPHAAMIGFLLLVLAVHTTAAYMLPTNLVVRVSQRSDFGVKLKVAYHINSPESTALSNTKIEMCANCHIDNKGDRQSNDGHVKTGSTCGGFPHGCAVVKRADWLFDSDQVSLHFRVGAEPWSTPFVFTGLKEVVKGGAGVVYLQQLEDTVKEEL